VTHFGGPYAALDEIVGKQFAAAGHGDVVYEQDQPGLIISKWQAQPNDPIYDIGFLTRDPTVRAGKSGLVEVLSEDKIPLLADCIPGTLAPGGAGVAMVFDAIDVAYDKEAVSEPLDSWLDLWRPELRGKIMLPASPLNSMVAVVLVSIARAMGGDERTVDEIFPKIAELKPHVRSFFGDPNQVTQLMERREVAIAPQYSARIGLAIAKNDFIARATPKEGVPSSPYDLVIAKGSNNLELAKKYVNFTLQPDIQKAICSAIPLTPANKNTELDPEAARLIISDSSRLFQYDYAYVASRQSEWADRWAREIAG
jgi:putative spermidine/putrescine transport system substrate-binding protein